MTVVYFAKIALISLLSKLTSGYFKNTPLGFLNGLSEDNNIIENATEAKNFRRIFYYTRN